MGQKTNKKPSAPRSSSLQAKKVGNGTLVIIGGREDKVGKAAILREIVDRVGPEGKIVIASAASEVPELIWEDYKKAFGDLGVKNIEHLSIERSEHASSDPGLRLLEGANCVFFTGGDQLKITSKLGGTPIAEKIFSIFHKGGLIAGTSAGAAAMGETMLVGGKSETHKVGDWMMAPGLGFLKNIIVDQHFAQRARIGRLFGAVAFNPGVLGIGIDENTSIVVSGHRFKVLGENAVYVVDGRTVSYTNASESSAEKTLAMHDITVHILADGEIFDMRSRRPVAAVPK